MGVVSIGAVIRNHVAEPLLPLSSPVGYNFVNKVGLLALRMSLPEARRINWTNLTLEGDFSCAIRWASGKCISPWRQANAIKEVLDLYRSFHNSFLHVKSEANSFLAKEELVGRLCIFIELNMSLCFSFSRAIGV